MTRQTVEVAFEVLVKFDVIEVLKPFLEAEIPNKKLILNIVDRDNSMVDEVYNLLLNSLRFQMGPLRRTAAGLLSLTPT